MRQLIRSGVDEHPAMAISGHKIRSIFSRYNIESLDDLKAATKKLDAGEPMNFHVLRNLLFKKETAMRDAR